MDVDSEYQESTTVTFEWTLRGLKALFDSSKGDVKSKVTKSPKFGGGRWQILFYANAGPSKEGKEGTTDTSGGFVSLYLSCEPTVEEKEQALAEGNHAWVREGVYKFSFELRNTGKTILYTIKEAQNHSFSHKTANWGWAQFARRDHIYYHTNPNKSHDAFVIICTIHSSPAPPKPVPSYPRKIIPAELIKRIGGLLDDPSYSDVEFILPRRGGVPRKIWASKAILKRAEYFESMFDSGFAEGSLGTSFASIDSSEGAEFVLENDSRQFDDHFEDSDNESDDFLDTESHSDKPISSANLSRSPSRAEDTPDADIEIREEDSTIHIDPVKPNPTDADDVVKAPDEQARAGPKKLQVVVKDVAYTTYRAVLYYLYTDTIVFAPLSSSFLSSTRESAGTPSSSPPSVAASAAQGSIAVGGKPTQNVHTAASRKEWIADWMRSNPGLPTPCSAKAAYRLADRLDLRELKERASQHILKSLTVENIAYEVFCPFAAAFDDIRKVQVNFFLDNWVRIRDSKSMRDVWHEIRSGRHPGFEEVWPVIVQNLEFKPTSRLEGTRDNGGSRAD
ncbi:hypothetical protein HGRIS_005939 [Hohenbuehelia grisea]|uniref:MATH domain-containing protein n=1 Tax=Hohenbuehelia grisea TaxID=104357 RepID=A0ABR3JYF7_9AGAR